MQLSFKWIEGERLQIKNVFYTYLCSYLYWRSFLLPVELSSYLMSFHLGLPLVFFAEEFFWDKSTQFLFIWGNLNFSSVF